MPKEVIERRKPSSSESKFGHGSSLLHPVDGFQMYNLVFLFIELFKSTQTRPLHEQNPMMSSLWLMNGVWHFLLTEPELLLPPAASKSKHSSPGFSSLLESALKRNLRVMVCCCEAIWKWDLAKTGLDKMSKFHRFERQENLIKDLVGNLSKILTIMSSGK